MWPPTTGEVADLLRLRSPQQAPDLRVLEAATDAAAADVATWRADLFAPVGDPPVPPPEPSFNVHYGTVMYAAHLYSNRVNTTGVDPVTDLGGGPSTFLPAIIQRLLGISNYAKPRIG